MSLPAARTKHYHAPSYSLFKGLSLQGTPAVWVTIVSHFWCIFSKQISGMLVVLGLNLQNCSCFLENYLISSLIGSHLSWEKFGSSLLTFLKRIAWFNWLENSYLYLLHSCSDLDVLKPYCQAPSIFIREVRNGSPQFLSWHSLLHHNPHTSFE